MLVRLSFAALGVLLFATAGVWLWRPLEQETAPVTAVEADAAAAVEADAAAAMALRREGAAAPAARSASLAQRNAGFPGETELYTASAHEDLERSGVGASRPASGGGRATTRPGDERVTDVRAGRETRPRDEGARPEDRVIRWEREGKQMDEGSRPIDDTRTEVRSDVPHSVRGTWGNVPHDPAASSRLFIGLLVDPGVSDVDIGTLVRDTRETYPDAGSLTVKVRETATPGENSGPLVALSRRNYETGEDFVNVRGQPVEP
jgi:hypothetical protein